MITKKRTQKVFNVQTPRKVLPPLLAGLLIGILTSLLIIGESPILMYITFGILTAAALLFLIHSVSVFLRETDQNYSDR